MLRECKNVACAWNGDHGFVSKPASFVVLLFSVSIKSLHGAVFFAVIYLCLQIDMSLIILPLKSEQDYFVANFSVS